MLVQLWGLWTFHLRLLNNKRFSLCWLKVDIKYYTSWPLNWRRRIGRFMVCDCKYIVGSHSWKGHTRQVLLRLRRTRIRDHWFWCALQALRLRLSERSREILVCGCKDVVGRYTRQGERRHLLLFIWGQGTQDNQIWESKASVPV